MYLIIELHHTKKTDTYFIKEGGIIFNIVSHIFAQEILIIL